jgi:hypothetical protein
LASTSDQRDPDPNGELQGVVTNQTLAFNRLVVTFMQRQEVIQEVCQQSGSRVCGSRKEIISATVTLKPLYA